MLDSFGCFSLLRSLVELSSLLSLVAWIKSWPNLHSVAFAVQILVYTSLNYPFINPQFSSHRSHRLGGVNVDHDLNPFDKICTSRLLAVVQRLWSSCDNSTEILSLFQLLTSTLDGSHVDPEGVGDGSIVHFTIVVNHHSPLLL